MAIRDLFNKVPTVTGSITNSLPIVPSETEDLAYVTRSIYVGVSGDIKMTMSDGNIVTRKNVPVGQWPWRVRKIWSTDTTATDMVADW